MIARLQKQEPVILRQIMLEAGYAPATADRPKQNLTQTDFWQRKLAEIDDEKILDKFYKIALDTSDKRACLEAGKEIFKLKDRYPATKSKVVSLYEKISELEKEN